MHVRMRMHFARTGYRVHETRRGLGIQAAQDERVAVASQRQRAGFKAPVGGVQHIHFALQLGLFRALGARVRANAAQDALLQGAQVY